MFFSAMDGTKSFRRCIKSIRSEKKICRLCDTPFFCKCFFCLCVLDLGPPPCHIKKIATCATQAEVSPLVGFEPGCLGLQIRY